MITLKQNYKRNVDILKENFKRGMDAKQASQAINNQEKQFINAGLYNQDEKDYINEMRKEMINYFLPLKIEIIN